MRVLKEFKGPSRTKQSFRDQCDVNSVLQRFRKVNGVDYLNVYKEASGGSYGDFSAVGDYRSALDAVRRADEAFMALPSNIRARFYNDPGEFLGFCENPANFDEMVRLGLAEVRKEVQPVVDDKSGT